MRSRRALLPVLAALALAGPAAAQANQIRGFTELDPVHAAAVPGADTGFALKPGAPITVRAFGSVCPFGTGFCNGPDGYPALDTTTSTAGGFLLPGAPAWALVARAGSGPWVQVGSGPTAVSGSGDLVFAVNDEVFEDNTGGFLAVFSYQCYPGNGAGDPNHYHCGPPGKN